jgi:phospholipase C
MKNIEHIVYLMLENRSMDSVLGWLYEKDNPTNFIPKTNTNPFDGLQTGSYFNPGKKVRVPITKIAVNQGQQIPGVDPHEKFEHVQVQIAKTMGVEMGGFYNDFSTVKGAIPNQIMETYTPDSLPVLNSLAKQFAVSDTYFSSIPTQTNCNRAFAGTGNSLGYYYNKPDDLKAWVNNSFAEYEKGELDVTFNQKTIWGVLNQHQKTSPDDWMIFHQDTWPPYGKYCFTRDLFWPTLQNQSDDNFGNIDAFFTKVSKGTLPKFSFLEPAWYEEMFGNGNDYHPPANLSGGEHFLYKLYRALETSPNWANTLLIINFDEHGGTYDHVTPPTGVKAPWDISSDGTQKPDSKECNFEFTRLGVRVPLVLVSPLIEDKTVIRSDSGSPFDHTSVIATILDHFNIPRNTWQLGSRTANAPTFEKVITLTPGSARMGVKITPPIPTSKSDKDVEPNDLQLMILHRAFARSIEQENLSKDRFKELYQKHFNNITTMGQLNEAAKTIMAQLRETQYKPSKKSFWTKLLDLFKNIFKN